MRVCLSLVQLPSCDVCRADTARFHVCTRLVFATLILSVQHRPDPASQTDHNQKRAARRLLIKSTPQLVLFIIAALLAFVLGFLASRGGHDVACHIVLGISLTCVNGSHVCDYQRCKFNAGLE
jgi:hypothetical protein